MIRELIVLTALAAAVPAPARLHRSAHHTAFVTVRPDVRLEILDWGGRGPALVFLAGFGDTGHVFDGFAPQFTNQYHVLAITRRGFGASSRPSGGYDTGTLTQDITSVLDSLGIRRAVFVGHSFAGTELSYLGVYHAERVARLIYVDASYDFPRLYADPRWKNAFPIPRPPAPAGSAIHDWRRWFDLVMGPALPDDEIRLLASPRNQTPADTTFQQAAFETDLGRIQVPVLALWAVPRSIEDQYPYWSSLDLSARARLRASFGAQDSERGSQLRTFRERVPRAHVALVAGGRHYLFLSHPQRVASEMRAFLATPPQP